ncbi:MAG: ribonuclease H family protein [Muribaculaceae bacterium]|nr:ribonuclease H family protein [Muribaculaceae bacterium]
MSNTKRKYYVVWAGHAPGVYDTWAECQLQTHGFPGARFKAFPSRDEAVAAFRGDPSEHLGIIRSILTHAPRPELPPLLAPGVRDYSAVPEIRLDAIAVDGACAGNPGRMEYRGVRVIDGAEVFHVGADGSYIGTNNIAEYLAIIHVAALLKRSLIHN